MLYQHQFFRSAPKSNQKVSHSISQSAILSSVWGCLGDVQKQEPIKSVNHRGLGIELMSQWSLIFLTHLALLSSWLWQWNHFGRVYGAWENTRPVARQPISPQHGNFPVYHIHSFTCACLNSRTPLFLSRINTLRALWGAECYPLNFIKRPLHVDKHLGQVRGSRKTFIEVFSHSRFFLDTFLPILREIFNQKVPGVCLFKQVCLFSTLRYSRPKFPMIFVYFAWLPYFKMWKWFEISLYRELPPNVKIIVCSL